MPLISIYQQHTANRVVQCFDFNKVYDWGEVFPMGFQGFLNLDGFPMGCRLFPAFSPQLSSGFPMEFQCFRCFFLNMVLQDSIFSAFLSPIVSQWCAGFFQLLSNCFSNSFPRCFSNGFPFQWLFFSYFPGLLQWFSQRRSAPVRSTNTASI